MDGKSLHPANVVGSPASSFAGIAAMAPALLSSLSTLTIPSTPLEWMQLVFGVLALFAKA